jgi:hypothetical protein
MPSVKGEGEGGRAAGVGRELGDGIRRRGIVEVEDRYREAALEKRETCNIEMTDTLG